MPHATATIRGAQGEETRTRLVEAAVSILEAGGEQAIRIRDIAAALGVSVGAVYHHFDGREDLIVAARLAQFEGVLVGDVDAVRELVANSSTVDEMRQGIRFLNRAAHSAARAPFRRLRAEVAGVAHHNAALAAEMSRVQAAYTDELTAALQVAKDKGLGNPSLDPRAVATFLQAIVLGLVLDDINLEQPMDREAWHALTDQMYDVLLAG